MSKKPFPRIITGAVIATIAAAAVLTFTRGEAPVTDTASATVPGVSDTSGPVVNGSTTTPKPGSPASADATERAAKSANSKTRTPDKTPVNSGPTNSPTTSPPRAPDPEPEPSPSPSPSPSPTRSCALLGFLGCK